jgi:hypothetical protein
VASDTSPFTFFKNLFKDCLDEERLAELRRICGKKVESLWFPDIESFLAETLAQPEGWEYYFGLHPRDRRKGNKDSISLVTCLHADLDFKDFPGGQEEIRGKLKALPQRPTVVVHSGNGLHAYWFLKEPEEIKDKDKFERIQRGLQEYLGADKTHDIARVLRIPGTFNYKK